MKKKSAKSKKDNNVARLRASFPLSFAKKNDAEATARVIESASLDYSPHSTGVEVVSLSCEGVDSTDFNKGVGELFENMSRVLDEPLLKDVLPRTIRRDLMVTTMSNGGINFSFFVSPMFSGLLSDNDIYVYITAL